MFDERADRTDSGARTRQRLLEAAGEVFAERGFRDASVREICAKAGANVAAINYHFGDKEKLYTAVLRYAHGCAAEQHAAAMRPGWEEASPEERLRLFVRGLLAKIFDDGRPAWHFKLMTREMFDPTAALDGLVRDEIAPMSELLSGIVRELLGPAASEREVRRCRYSVVGQCLFYHFGRPVLERLEGSLPEGRIGDTRDPAELEALADHITRFSVAAMSGPDRPGGGGGAP